MKPMPNMLDQLKEELDSIPALHPRWVISGFPAPWEKEFKIDTIGHSLGLVRFTLAWAFTLMAGFGIINEWILPLDNAGPWISYFTVVRIAVICPYILFCFISTFLKAFRRIAYPALCASAFLAAAGVCGRIVFSAQPEQAYSLYYSGLILVCIGLHVGFNMRVIYAAMTGAAVLIVYGITVFFVAARNLSPSGAAVLVNSLFFLVSTGIMLLVACFFNEYYRRNAFLLKKRISLEERLNKLKAIENWKEAYRINKEIDSDLARKNLRKTLRVGKTERPPAEVYLNKLKSDQASSGMLSLVRTVGTGVAAADLFEKLMEVALEISGARRGCIILRNEKTEELEFVVRRNLEKSDMRTVLAVVYDALDSGKTIMIDDGPRVSGIRRRPAASDRGARALLCFPVEYGGRAIGACYLDGDEAAGAFSGESGEMAVFLLTQAVLSFRDAAWRGPLREIVIDEAHFREECARCGFTDREEEILLLLIKGFSNKAICEKSFISMNTLRTHLKRIYDKAGVADRKQLIDLFAKYEID
jgi:DNA-binding CsgD family transcriptional regulator